VQETLGSATRHLGFLVMFLGVGMFLGSVAYGGLGSKFSKVKAIFASLIICGILIVCFTVFVKMFSSFLISALIAFMIGLSASPIAILTNTLLHEVIPNGMRGKVFSSLEIISHLAFLVFMLVSAFLGERIDKMWILISVGAIFSIFGIIGLLLKFRYE
jgi:MFS family permease